MSQFDDLPPPRRPLFFPVVIATVLLSVIGMSAGLALGSRHRATPAVVDQPDVIPPTGATDAPDGIACPEQMHDTAQRLGYSGPLIQVLKVRAEQTSLEVWICRDTDGKLFYQGNTGGPDNWAEGRTALFLDNVVRRGDGYFAKATDGNTFDVDDERLVVVRNGKKQTSAVTPE